MKAKPTKVNRADALIKEKAKTVLSNVGFYLMLAFDIVFLVVLVLAGFTAGAVAATSVVLGIEVVAVLFLLPVPLLQVGMVRKNILYAIIFLIMPIMEIVFSRAVSSYGELSAVYAIFAGGRLLMLFMTFLAAKLGYGSGAGIFISLTFALVAMLGAGTIFEAPIGNRPLSYAYYEDYGGYVVTSTLAGVRDNVRIPATYKGEPVVGVEITYAGTMRNLDLPESVRYVTLQSDSLKNLTVRGESVTFSNCKLSSLKTLRFTADKAPENLPFSKSEMLTAPSVYFKLDVLNAALRSENLYYARECFDLDTESESSVIYYTDCALSESGEIEGLHEDAVEWNGDGVSTPELDLSKDGYAFIGWYDSRGYVNKVDRVERGEHRKLYAKYLRLYTVKLSDYSGLVKTELQYHNEMSLTLPAPEERDGYAFCGWFNHDTTSSNRVKGEDIKIIPVGSSGGKWFSPEYKKLYNITVHDDSGKILAEIPEKFHEWSDEIWLPNNGAEKDGYTFMGWFLDERFTLKEDRVPLNAGKDLDLYPKFNKNYNITVHTQGGSSVTLPPYYHVESDTIVLPPSTRTGYNFDGWYEDSAGSGSKVEKIEKGSEGDKTFYAKWTPIKYAIRYSAGLGEGAAMSDTTFTYDATNTLSVCSYTRTGYTFAGWRLNGKVYQPGVDITENFTNVDGAIIPAEAQWTPITYTVKYLQGEGGGGADMPSSTFTYDANNRLSVCTYTRTGYHFVGWQISGQTYQPNANISVNFASEQGAEVQATALWGANEYRVRYLTGLNSGDFTQTYTYDSSVTIPNCTTPNTGYEFAGWKINGTVYQFGSSGTYNFTSEENGQVMAVAQWTPITYTVKYVAGEGSGEPMSNSTFTYNSEDNRLSICTYIRTGYIFAGWKIGGQTYQPNVYISENFASSQGAEVTATATWTPITYTVKYVAGEGGGNAMPNSTFTYDAQNRLSECTYTRTGYEFAGWQISGSTYQPGVNVSENFASSQGAEVTATATWTAITYKVKYSTWDGKSFTETYTYDQNVTIPKCTETRMGYTFSGWSINGSTYQADQSGKFNFSSTKDAEVTATATWTPITYTVKYVAGEGGGEPMSNSTFTYNSEDNRLSICTYIRTGYIFAGWKIGGQTYQPGVVNVNFASNQGAEITATATWTPVTYTVKYVANGEGAEGSTENSLFTYDGNNNELRSCGYTRDGYEFVGWSTVPNPSSEKVYPAGKIGENLSSGEEVTLYAIWRQITPEE